MDHLAATPVAPIIAAADPEARKKIGASVVERLQCYADNDGGFRMPADFVAKVFLHS